jgi:hypothetical protein
VSAHGRDRNKQQARAFFPLLQIFENFTSKKLKNITTNLKFWRFHLRFCDTTTTSKKDRDDDVIVHRLSFVILDELLLTFARTSLLRSHSSAMPSDDELSNAPKKKLRQSMMPTRMTGR